MQTPLTCHNNIKNPSYGSYLSLVSLNVRDDGSECKERVHVGDPIGGDGHQLENNPEVKYFNQTTRLSPLLPLIHSHVFSAPIHL
jgi:hypothetical protein